MELNPICILIRRGPPKILRSGSRKLVITWLTTDDDATYQAWQNSCSGIWPSLGNDVSSFSRVLSEANFPSILFEFKTTSKVSGKPFSTNEHFLRKLFIYFRTPLFWYHAMPIMNVSVTILHIWYNTPPYLHYNTTWSHCSAA